MPLNDLDPDRKTISYPPLKSKNPWHGHLQTYIQNIDGWIRRSEGYK